MPLDKLCRNYLLFILVIVTSNFSKVLETTSLHFYVEDLSPWISCSAIGLLIQQLQDCSVNEFQIQFCFLPEVLNQL